METLFLVFGMNTFKSSNFAQFSSQTLGLIYHIEHVSSSLKANYQTFLSPLHLSYSAESDPETHLLLSHPINKGHLVIQTFSLTQFHRTFPLFHIDSISHPFTSPNSDFSTQNNSRYSHIYVVSPYSDHKSGTIIHPLGS